MNAPIRVKMGTWPVRLCKRGGLPCCHGNKSNFTLQGSFIVGIPLDHCDITDLKKKKNTLKYYHKKIVF